jgi:ArsR family transcriptional regulator, arsenate/arsenite/antimonite-responsive transcriptional repressor
MCSKGGRLPSIHVRETLRRALSHLTSLLRGSARTQAADWPARQNLRQESMAVCRRLQLPAVRPSMAACGLSSIRCRRNNWSAPASRRGRSRLPEPSRRGVPGAGEPAGICVCDFQEHFHLGQSKVSYHLRVLREAGLVREEARGKWSFYAIDGEAAATAIDALRDIMRV